MEIWCILFRSDLCFCIYPFLLHVHLPVTLLSSSCHTSPCLCNISTVYAFPTSWSCSYNCLILPCHPYHVVPNIYLHVKSRSALNTVLGLSLCYYSWKQVLCLKYFGAGRNACYVQNGEGILMKKYKKKTNALKKESGHCW